MFLSENVPSTEEINREYESYLPLQGGRFEFCGSSCSPSVRKRLFHTNRPPVVCAEDGKERVPGKDPPSLNGDLPEYLAHESVALREDGRMLHPELKKLPTFTHSGGNGSTYRDILFEIGGDDGAAEPVRLALDNLTGDEAERAMGYVGDEIGVTARSAERAVRNKILNHNYERDGHLVSLKGCGEDKLFPPEPVKGRRRLELLGNSQVVTVLEALIWNDRQLFPPISHEP